MNLGGGFLLKRRKVVSQKKHHPAQRSGAAITRFKRLLQFLWMNLHSRFILIKMKIPYTNAWLGTLPKRAAP